MTKLANKVVALTGAASGIGRALAMELDRRGAHIAISDVDLPGLEKTAGMLSGKTKVTTHRVDVRDRDAVAGYAADIESAHGGVDVLINNAGLTARGSVETMSDEDFELVMDVDFWGVVHGVRKFMPYLRKRPAAHIVNIASLNSMAPFPLNGPYNAAKYAVLGLSETLMQELRTDPIKVSVVHPGGIKTNIVRNSRGTSEYDVKVFDRIARTTPEQAAKIILNGVERDKKRIYVGMDAVLISTAKRIWPNSTVAFMERIARPRTR